MLSQSSVATPASRKRSAVAFQVLAAYDHQIHSTARTRREQAAAAERLVAFKTLVSVARQIVCIADALESSPSNNVAPSVDHEKHRDTLATTLPYLGHTLKSQLERLTPHAPHAPLENLIRRATDTLVHALATSDHVIVIFPQDATAALTAMPADLRSLWTVAVDIRIENLQLSFHLCGDRWACSDEGEIELLFLDALDLRAQDDVALWLPEPRTMAGWWARWAKDAAAHCGNYTTIVDLTLFSRKDAVPRERLQFE